MGNSFSLAAGIATVRACDISPLPRMSPKQRKTRATKASVLTASPYHRNLLEKKAEKAPSKKQRKSSKSLAPLLEKHKVSAQKKRPKADKKRKSHEEDEVTSKKKKTDSFTIGCFVIFSYEGEIFPGEILGMTDQGSFTIKAMQKSGRH
jgi:hypothetical protein